MTLNKQQLYLGLSLQEAEWQTPAEAEPGLDAG